MTRTTPRLLSVAALALLSLAFAGRAAAKEYSAKELYKQTLRATGLVWTPYGRGTGWVIDRGRKLMITNHHVVAGEGSSVVDEVAVVFPEYRKDRVVAQRDAYLDGRGSPIGHAVRGKVIDSDPSRDLALIQLDEVPAEVTELRLADDSPEPGERLHSVGNPGVSAAMWVYTQGVVRTVVKRQIRYEHQFVEARVVETTSPVNPGDSGGPVVNDEGVLVGVTSGFTKEGQLMSFCIDVTEVKKFVEASEKLLNPNGARRHVERGRYYLRKQRAGLALADFDAAIKLDPENAAAYLGRGQAYRRAKAYEKAVADFNRAIELNAEYAEAYGALSWLLATCPKAECRDGARAVEAGQQACELTGWKDANLLDTLAAAYAEAGQLDKAVETEAAAVKLAPGKKLEVFRSRLEDYQQRMKAGE
jgi:S1-C subfamily serine protease